MRGDITHARIYFCGSKILFHYKWITDQWGIFTLGVYLPLRLCSFICFVFILCTKGTKIDVILSLGNLVFSELLEVQRNCSCRLLFTSVRDLEPVQCSYELQFHPAAAHRECELWESHTQPVMVQFGISSLHFIFNESISWHGFLQALMLTCFKRLCSLLS